ncbi:hypothetical protein [Catellatospora chokoriensis]|uniref:Uncharacterized protein n=1 Tax=Catellatospora chokoriensis TaxID=310353 RepID=A0A8J3KAY3_9ACTN|nr:hypothetical protein [Catellatospora chokoriensis]GIF91794.1 hypothetical protein Cch02nite_52380 [Catellatospora chokoriensis]
MGGRSYMLATRMPMSREGFDAWLHTPLPGRDVITNPDEMWLGWATADMAPDWELTAIAGSPAAVATYRASRTRTPLELLAARAAGGFTLARHHDGALEIYLYDYHADTHGTLTNLLMLAGAGRFADGNAETPVLYWGGDVHPGLPIDDRSVLSVLLVGRTAARFTARYPFPALTQRLLPVEEAFLGAVVDPEGDEPGWDSSEVLDPSIGVHAVR